MKYLEDTIRNVGTRTKCDVAAYVTRKETEMLKLYNFDMQGIHRKIHY